MKTNNTYLNKTATCDTGELFSSDATTAPEGSVVTLGSCLGRIYDDCWDAAAAACAA